MVEDYLNRLGHSITQATRGHIHIHVHVHVQRTCYPSHLGDTYMYNDTLLQKLVALARSMILNFISLLNSN